MIKILSTEQIRQADEFTIKNESITSYELMERASKAFVTKFLDCYTDRQKVRIFCGVGNNGGDGLAVGRMLREHGWEVLKYIVGNPRKGSEDFKQNLEKSDLYAVIQSVEDLPEIGPDEIIVDALFGSGLSRPVAGLHREVLEYLNQQHCTKLAVDIPSGLFGDRPTDSTAVVFEADRTISFQYPKLAFLLPESYKYVGEWLLVDIGLSQGFIDKASSTYRLTEAVDVKRFIPRRDRFTHKSKVGMLMIVAGSKGKMGAAILATQAAFRAGAGLVNVCSSKLGTPVLQTAVPEAMVLESDAGAYVGKIPATEGAIVLGPGLGTQRKTMDGLETLLEKTKQPMVIDADGLNLLAKKKELLELVPRGSILTPHPGEFKRLVGEWSHDFDKLDLLTSFCRKYKLNMVLKGAFSAVCNSEGLVSFNASGNPVLATAGSGDVLAGMIGAFLANGLVPIEALKLGVYIHGYCGDLLAKKHAGFGTTASDIIATIPQALSEISN